MESTFKNDQAKGTISLRKELKKGGIKLDEELGNKAVRAVVHVLGDGEVQELAVKCLGPLVNKVKENQVETIVDLLCTNMVSNNKQLRDISSIGLKTVISELPQTPSSLAPKLCQRTTEKLNAAFSMKDVSVQLDILSDLLSRFGELLIPFHEEILDALLPQLSSQLPSVQKRTNGVLSHLLTSCKIGLCDKIKAKYIKDNEHSRCLAAMWYVPWVFLKFESF